MGLSKRLWRRWLGQHFRSEIYLLWPTITGTAQLTSLPQLSLIRKRFFSSICCFHELTQNRNIYFILIKKIPTSSSTTCYTNGQMEKTFLSAKYVYQIFTRRKYEAVLPSLLFQLSCLLEYWENITHETWLLALCYVKMSCGPLALSCKQCKLYRTPTISWSGGHSWKNILHK